MRYFNLFDMFELWRSLICISLWKPSFFLFTQLATTYMIHRRTQWRKKKNGKGNILPLQGDSEGRSCKETLHKESPFSLCFTCLELKLKLKCPQVMEDKLISSKWNNIAQRFGPILPFSILGWIKIDQTSKSLHHFIKL